MLELAEALLKLAEAAWRGLRRRVADLGLVTQPSARLMALWREAARTAGVAAVEEAPGGIVGWAGPLRIHLSRFEDGESRGTRISIAGPGLPADLTLRPEGSGGSIRRKSVRGIEGEIEVGDEGFDRVAWVEGPAAVLRSLLDADTRRAIRGLLEGRLERPGRSPFWATGRLDGGVLRIDVPDEFPRRRPRGVFDGAGVSAEEPLASAYIGGLAHLPEVLQLSIAVARRLAAPDDVARRIADGLRAEPVARVRLLNLVTLAREFPDHPATREALVAGREDPDAEVRLQAGIALGPEGRDVVLAVANGEGAEDATTERAVVALGSHLATAEGQGILRNALRTRREATARACLGALGQRRGTVGTLARVLAVEKPELAAAAADALGATGDASAEAPLLAALGSPHTTLRTAAARALGRVGTTAAVQPLKEAETRDAEMRRAARQAIAEIQARAKGAAPGQLSLAGGESGQLSLASEERGRLSLVPSSRAPALESGDEESAGAADPAEPGRRNPPG